ncbi:MAG: ATP-dependent 6-phosphofructokinase [Verrucomicrobiales bacterium]|nr:ATP-dependent 6-phosphofructokinase [Verrucomicrobiales bacterium]
MRIGLLNGGGDCPGLNAVTHGVVGAAAQLGWEVVGFKEGYEGLLSPVKCKILKRSKTEGILKLGGTILGTSNRGRFSSKVGEGGVRKIPSELMDEAIANLREQGVQALVCAGGDGTLTTALQFMEEGFPVVGVPKTIDNDLGATAMTFGFDSATQVVVDALDRLQTTAESHKRVMVLEVMGRHAGWIALYGGIGGGASAILIPEIPFHYDKVADILLEREARGFASSLVVVAEGASPLGEEKVYEETGGGGEDRLGGVGERVAKKLGELTGKETRSTTLGHLQRGGSPTSFDRVLATRFGVKAVNLIEQKRFGRMVSYQQYHVGSVLIEKAVKKLNLVDPEGEIVRAAKSVGISFGDEA